LESLLAALKKKVSTGDPSRKQLAEELGRKNNAQRKTWRDVRVAPSGAFDPRDRRSKNDFLSVLSLESVVAVPGPQNLCLFVFAAP
jgi:hypothetical protein